MRERSTVDEGTSGKFAKPPATESLESLLKTQIPIIASGSRIRESAFFFLTKPRDCDSRNISTGFKTY